MFYYCWGQKKLATQFYDAKKIQAPHNIWPQTFCIYTNLSKFAVQVWETQIAPSQFISALYSCWCLKRFVISAANDWFVLLIAKWQKTPGASDRGCALIYARERFVSVTAPMYKRLFSLSQQSAAVPWILHLGVSRVSCRLKYWHPSILLRKYYDFPCTSLNTRWGDRLALTWAVKCDHCVSLSHSLVFGSKGIM
jgi:hypothetical protein